VRTTSGAYRRLRRYVHSRQSLWDRLTAGAIAVMALVVLVLVVLAARSTP
jgi:hypothetical protein